MIHFGRVRPPALLAGIRPVELRPRTTGIDREELILARPLVCEEEVRLVLHDGATDRPAVLISPIVRLRRLKVLSGGQRGIAEEQQTRPPNPVRSPLRSHPD